jgi:hypothetical protein
MQKWVFIEIHPRLHPKHKSRHHLSLIWLLEHKIHGSLFNLEIQMKIGEVTRSHVPLGSYL